jgi:hypothetical protein
MCVFSHENESQSESPIDSLTPKQCQSLLCIPSRTCSRTLWIFLFIVDGNECNTPTPGRTLYARDAVRECNTLLQPAHIRDSTAELSYAPAAVLPRSIAFSKANTAGCSKEACEEEEECKKETAVIWLTAHEIWKLAKYLWNNYIHLSDYVSTRLAGVWSGVNVQGCWKRFFSLLWHLLQKISNKGQQESCKANLERGRANDSKDIVWSR